MILDQTDDQHGIVPTPTRTLREPARTSESVAADVRKEQPRAIPRPAPPAMKIAEVRERHVRDKTP